MDCLLDGHPTLVALEKLYGFPITSGRGAPEPVFVGSNDRRGVKAWPEYMGTMPFNCQPCVTHRAAPEFGRKRFPGPMGSSYDHAEVNWCLYSGPWFRRSALRL